MSDHSVNMFGGTGRGPARDHVGTMFGALGRAATTPNTCFLNTLNKIAKHVWRWGVPMHRPWAASSGDINAHLLEGLRQRRKFQLFHPWFSFLLVLHIFQAAKEFSRVQLHVRTWLASAFILLVTVPCHFFVAIIVILVSILHNW